MKYGVLEYKNPNCINIGDAMQIMSVLNLYRRMGFEENDIVRINFYDLQTYDGEEVIVPICFPFYGYNSENRITCFSKKIIPVFLSLSLIDTNLDDKEVEYLKKYEPIGCRDSYTADGLAEKGLDTYLSGCMTMTLDGRKKEKGQTEVYCIDVPDELYQYMPEDFKENIQKRTHIFRSVGRKTDEYAGLLLEEYMDRAKLVVTSRLHAALPCFAAGIPVVFVHSEYSYRFSWLEGILHVYLPNEWGQINWSGDCIAENSYAQNIREMIYEVARARLLNQKKSVSQIEKLQQMYMQEERRAYTRGPYDLTVNFINNRWDRNTSIEYAVWGVSQIASLLIDYISGQYPNAKLVTVIDANKSKPFKGHIPVKIHEETRIKDLFVFVTADAVNSVAAGYFCEIGKNPETYYMCWNHIKSEGGGFTKSIILKSV